VIFKIAAFVVPLGFDTLAVAIAVAVYLVSGGPGAANLGFGSFVTNFLPGELQQVPDPCTTLPAAMLNQFLPGTPKEAAPPLNSGANTQCTWTLDNPPTYRVLEVQLQAYSPSGLASGDGLKRNVQGLLERVGLAARGPALRRLAFGAALLGLALIHI